MKQFFLALTAFLLSFTLTAQHNPVSFEISHENQTIVFKASIEKGWHLYAAHLPNPFEGPLPTEIIFNESEQFVLQDSIIESVGHTEMDDAFGIEVKYFENSATFKQPIKVTSKADVTISGTIYYMVCNDEMCIPLERAFSYIYK